VIYKVTIEDQDGNKEEYEFDQVIVMGEKNDEMQFAGNCDLTFKHLVLGKLTSDITREWIMLDNK